MTIGIRTWKKLDEKMCFDYYIKYGSLRKARERLIHDHPNEMLNERTDEYYSLPAVNNAAWKHIVANPVECRPIIADAWEKDGKLLTDEEWKIMLVTHMRDVLHYSNSKLFQRMTDMQIEEHFKDALRPMTTDNRLCRP